MPVQLPIFSSVSLLFFLFGLGQGLGTKDSYSLLSCMVADRHLPKQKEKAAHRRPSLTSSRRETCLPLEQEKDTTSMEVRLGGEDFAHTLHTGTACHLPPYV